MTEHDMIAGTKRGLAHCFDALLADCHSIMARYARRWSNVLAYEDGMQFARLSVWRAAMRFDPDRGVSFAGYAQRRIRADLRRRAEDWGSDVDDKTPGPKGGGLRLTGVVRAIRYDHVGDEDDNIGADLYVNVAADQEDPLCVRDIDAAVRRALPMLTPRQRDIVQAFLAEPDMTGDEVATALAMGTRQNVRQARRDAFAALRCHPAIRSIARDYGLLEAA